MATQKSGKSAPDARRREGQTLRHRLLQQQAKSLAAWGSHTGGSDRAIWPENVVVDCGWGRLIFAQTFDDPAELARTIRRELPEKRDIAFYVRDPQVVVAQAPQYLFLDPSHSFRLWINKYRGPLRQPQGFHIRRLQDEADIERINTIYAARNMVTVDPVRYRALCRKRHLINLLAVDEDGERILGTVTGIDHVHAFSDPENGSSLWCLAVDPQAPQPGVGEALVHRLTQVFAARGRSFMDLSVLWDNEKAIALYEKLGFERVPIFTVKTKNPINEALFTTPSGDMALNPYARIITDEARRRGIAVEILDAEGGFFRLTHGGRSIACRESLSQLTDAVAMSRCDDKAVTVRLFRRHDLAVPDQIVAGDIQSDRAFLARYGRVVVKPTRGEQGRGITVDVTDPQELAAAIRRAREVNDVVLLEEFVSGQDLRVIVIDYRVVAAAVRRPAHVVGTGDHTIRELIRAQSRRREAATGGESRIPLDAETERCIRLAGHELSDVLPARTRLEVRKTANLHTGGTIHDVTDQLHPALVDVSVRAARAIAIPVVGFDLIVPDVRGPDYRLIEANERPGLANHEPQPTAERYIDLLFPGSGPEAARRALAGTVRDNAAGKASRRPLDPGKGQECA